MKERESKIKSHPLKKLQYTYYNFFTAPKPNTYIRHTLSNFWDMEQEKLPCASQR